MSRNKKPVVVVAILLGALILLPVVIFVIARLGTSPDPRPTDPAVASSTGSSAAAVDYDLSQLAEKAENLLAGKIAEALRQGDVSLDFVAGLNRQLESAQRDMRRGRNERAQQRFMEVMTVAEERLAALDVADKARELRERTYAKLQRLDHLRANFENTYREALTSYDSGVSSLRQRAFAEAVESFELAGAVLGDLETRAMQQAVGLLEAAESALEQFRLERASELFQAVLELDGDNATAAEGLEQVAALEGIEEEVRAIRALVAEDELEAALDALEGLAAEHPENAFVKRQLAAVEAQLLEREFDALVARSVAAEASGDLTAAIADTEAALELKSDSEQQQRLAQLQQAYQVARLETVLEDGFQALRDGRYEEARDLYQEAVALDADSEEARTGLERASSLFLASIRYRQNLSAAERYIREGRFPVAARLFNQAMTTRPSNLPADQQAREETIRNTLAAQSEEVPVVVKSDGRTFVSIIGVMPPDRFRETDLKLFPDVYRVRGTRSGYKDVEKELRVDATQGSQTITVTCNERI